MPRMPMDFVARTRIAGRCARALPLLALGAIAVGCGSPSSSEDTGPIPPITTAPSDSSSGDGGTSSTSAEPSSTTGPGSSSAADGESTVAPPLFDIGTQPDFAPPECLECGLTIASQQSGVFEVTGANVFATAVLLDDLGAPQDVYALGTYGTGRFIATADSSLPFNEVSDCPLTSWLGGGVEGDPALLYFGWTPSDGPIQFAVPGMVGAGVHLPAQYIGNPAQLRADYDIVMYLEASGQFDAGDEPTDQEMQTLLDYVELHGGGAYISSEFASPVSNAYLNQDDLDSVNRLLLPLGLESLQVSLNWGNVDGNIDFDCFPPPVG
jgi:hypothetical protein